MGKYNKRIRRDKEGVSPVIATILMVAVTVVIAATVYSYTSGSGSNNKSTPAVRMTVSETTGDDILLSHDGGDDLEWIDLKVTVNGTTTSVTEGTGDFTVGEEQTIFDGTDSYSYDIKVIWTPTNAILLDKAIRV